MAAAAVAAAIDHSFFHGFWNFESAGFVFVQCPKMVFFVEIGITACGFMRLEFVIAGFQKFTVAHGFDSYIFFPAGGAVAGKGEDIGSGLYHSVNNIGNFINVGTGRCV